jgi:hypothetical protein
LPDWLPESSWTDWIEHRLAIKLPLTQRTAELSLKHLATLVATGQNPVAVIEQSVRTGKWPDLYPIKSEQQTSFPARPAKFDAAAYVNSGAAYANAAQAPICGAVEPFTIDAQFVERF